MFKHKKRINALEAEVDYLTTEIYFLKRSMFRLKNPPKFKPGDTAFIFNKGVRKIKIYHASLRDGKYGLEYRYHAMGYISLHPTEVLSKKEIKKASKYV